MPTTLDIDQDVLLATKALAQERGVSIGRVLSDLARQALTSQQSTQVRNGVPLFPVREGAAVVTPELVSRLRDEEPA